MIRRESAVLQLPPKTKLVAREGGWLPLQAILVDSSAAFVLGLLISVKNRVRECDDVLPLVVLEQLQGCASTREAVSPCPCALSRIKTGTYVFMTSA